MASLIPTVRPEFSCVSLALDWPGATQVRVERRTADSRYVPVKSGLEIDLVGGKAVVDDYEAPMDVELTYRMMQVVPASSADPVVVTGVTLASNGWSWLKDPAIPSRNVRLDEITNMEVETYASRAGVFDIIDRSRPVVVAALRRDRTTQLDITTATEAQRQAVELILSSGQVLLLSTPIAYAWGNEYVHIGDVTESRVGVADEPTRRWVMPITVVDRPIALSYQPATMTWADVVGDWPTWSDLTAEVDTWQDLIDAAPQ